MLLCHVMLRTDVFQIRIEPELRDHLARLRDERHVNVSAWARDVIAAALDREFPADLEAPNREPLAGWRPCKLGDGWGAVLDGPGVAALAEDPRGTRSASPTTGAAPGRLRSPRSSPATRSASSSATPAGRRTSLLDTLSVAQALTAGGIDRDQAEVIANAMRKLAEQGDQLHGRPVQGRTRRGPHRDRQTGNQAHPLDGRDRARDGGSDVRNPAVSRQVTPNAA